MTSVEGKIEQDIEIRKYMVGEWKLMNRAEFEIVFSVSENLGL